ncbi:MAG: ACT domain-containing protein [Kiritimatiellae bacterium]|nr:ACT domain-containing protein [Kiritimatiellia bacterium]
MSLNQVSIFLENRAGQLARVCKTLAAQNVSLIALSLAESQEFGIVRLIVDDSAKAAQILKAENFLVASTAVTAVAVPDRPGGMSEVAAFLSERGCDIEYSYAFAIKQQAKAVLVFRFKDEAKASAALAEAGYETLDEAALKA